MSSTTESDSTIHHSSQAEGHFAAGRWSLCIVHHKDAANLGRTVVLPPSQALELGRRYDGFGKGVLNDGRVSRDHATLRVHRDGAVELKDAGSHNGTYVNGARVEGAALLAHGDVLRLGSILLLVGYDRARPRTHHEALVPGLSAALAELNDRLPRLAATARPVAVCGESGVGRTLVAEAIHAASKRTGKLVRVPCASIPDRLIATELFGHEAGAFPGADEPHDGYIPRAAGGTVLLVGLEDASTKLQRAVLGFLDDGVANRLGSDEPLAVDARVIVQLSAEPDQCGLLADLATRLTQEVVALPPLRDRPEDVALLARRFAEDIAGKPVDLHWRTAQKLIRFSWPGNARQLRQVVDSALDEWTEGRPLKLSESAEKLLTARPPAQAAAAPSPPEDAEPGVTLPPRRLSKKRLQELLREHEGNVTAIANELGIGRNTLYRWLKVAGLDQADYRSG